MALKSVIARMQRFDWILVAIFGVCIVGGLPTPRSMFLADRSNAWCWPRLLTAVEFDAGA
jgi:hypothetical protein